MVRANCSEKKLTKWLNLAKGQYTTAAMSSQRKYLIEEGDADIILRIIAESVKRA